MDKSKEAKNAGREDTGSIESATSSERAQWGSPIEFFFTCVAYAVGLGNVWRFPYLCFKNGGGAFLIPYIIMMVFVGIPLFYLEVAFGQFASLGPVTIWKASPIFKGLGYCSIVTETVVFLYYAIIIGISFQYLFASLTDYLPWSNCSNGWNVATCRTGPNQTAPIDAITGNVTKATSPSEDYFYRKVLNISGGLEEPGEMQWQLVLCLLLTWVICLLALIKGIKSLGKVVYFTALFPYIMLTTLLIRSAMLEGSLDGVIFYLKPDFSRLADAQVWSDAAVQIFYSLSACTGGLIAMSSFNKFNNNCLRDSILVPLINCGTSLYAGFLIFSVLGFMAAEKGVQVSEVAAGGPGLVFVVYPEALSKMPVAPLWSALFFVMMLTLGFGSLFSMVECVFATFSDEFPILKRHSLAFRVISCAAFFLLGLPMCNQGGQYLLTLVDESIGGFPLLFVGLLETTVISWVYGYDRFAKDIEQMLGSKPGLYWKLCWKYISPGILLAVIIYSGIQYAPVKYGDYEYPAWGHAIGYCIMVFPLALIPAFFMGQWLRLGGWQSLKEAALPQEDWGARKDEFDSQAGEVMLSANGLGGAGVDLVRMDVARGDGGYNNRF